MVKNKKNSRKNLLKKIIKKEKRNKIIMFYKIFVILWLFFLIMICSLKFQSAYNNFKDFKVQFEVIKVSSQIIRRFSDLISLIYFIDFHKRGLTFQFSNKTEREQELQKYKTEINLYVKELKDNLKKFNYYSTSKLDDYIDEFNHKTEPEFDLNSYQKDQEQLKSLEEKGILNKEILGLIQLQQTQIKDKKLTPGI